MDGEIDITIGGTDESGASAKILTYLARKGYQPRDYRITRTESGSAVKFKLDLAQLDHARLAADIRGLNPAYTLIEGEVLSGAELLKALADRFPDIAALVHAHASSLPLEKRPEQLFEAGRKIGALVYKRDWSLGAPLRMPHALRRALVPALSRMCRIEAADDEVAVLDPRFASTGGLVHCCEFVGGFIRGFLAANPATDTVRVQRAGCAASGAPRCRFAFSAEAP